VTFKFQDFPRYVRTLYKVIGELEPADQIGSTDSRHDLNESLVALERASHQHCCCGRNPTHIRSQTGAVQVLKCNFLKSQPVENYRKFSTYRRRLFVRAVGTSVGGVEGQLRINSEHRFLHLSNNLHSTAELVSSS